MPDNLSFEEGAAFLVNYGTAYAGLIIMGGLRTQNRVLIHSAAGGVGTAAIQIACNAGAEIFGTASAAKHPAIKAQGVHHAIDYRSQDFKAEVRRLTNGEGVDIIMDAIGPSSFRKDYRILRPGGRLIMYGLSEALNEDGRGGAHVGGARSVPPMPDNLSFEEGAAFPVNYGTAYAGLIIMGGLRTQNRVLIHSAAGGVGIAAIQIACNAGAEIFGTASAAKHPAIKAQGVHHAIDYRSQDFKAEVYRLTNGEGVDIIMDAIGPSSFRKDYRILRPGGWASPRIVEDFS
jgi:NADPH:quinone reductase-like Zn-dependent oxidoreductase